MSPKMTKNKKIEFCLYQLFLFLPFLKPLGIPLEFWYFLGNSRVYSKHFGILLLKFEQKLNFSQLFFQKKNIKIISFALRPKMAEILTRYVD